MEKSYSQLTKEDRTQIYALLQAGKKQNEIAAQLNRNPSTISREIKRNCGKRGYRYKQAHTKAMERRRKPVNIKMVPAVVEYIVEKLNEEWSPEQISNTMKPHTGISVSHERIYQYIYQDKRCGGALYKKLRIAGKRRRRKRYGKKDFRGKIPNRVDIKDRPSLIDSKHRFGDWEADLVSGTHHRGYLVTLVERKSKFTLIGFVQNKLAKEVRCEIIRLFTEYPWPVHSITYDNGLEFADHATVKESLECESYFARPYHSWERGLNENTNGLIRQYFPKKTDLRNVSEDETIFVMNRLNNRPRKLLEFRTPKEILKKAG